MLRKFVLTKLYKYEHSTFYFIEKFLKFSGIWYPDSSMRNTVIMYITYTFNCIFVLSSFINLIFNFGFNLFVLFIHASSFYLTLHKGGVIIVNRKRFRKAVAMLTELELEAASKKGSKEDEIIDEHKKYTILYTYTYWFVMYACIVVIIIIFWIFCILKPIFGPVENLTPMTGLFVIWLPFNQHSKYGRILSGTIQSVFGLTAVSFSMLYDGMFMSTMIFLTGQLKVLKVRCNNALDAQYSEERCRLNIIKCHNHYINLLRCVEHISTLISPVMFLQFLQISTVLGVCIMKIVLDTNSTVEILWFSEMFSGTLFHLWLEYSVANNVTTEAESLSYAVFESNWVGKSPRLQRDVAILAAGMQRRILFKAGPWTDISLRTLAQILKATYSFYALLSNTYS